MEAACDKIIEKYESRKTRYWTETEDELLISLVDFHFDGAPSLPILMING
jgi:hypothetical protein